MVGGVREADESSDTATPREETGRPVTGATEEFDFPDRDGGATRDRDAHRPLEMSAPACGRGARSTPARLDAPRTRPFTTQRIPGSPA